MKFATRLVFFYTSFVFPYRLIVHSKKKKQKTKKDNFKALRCALLYLRSNVANWAIGGDGEPVLRVTQGVPPLLPVLQRQGQFGVLHCCQHIQEGTLPNGGENTSVVKGLLCICGPAPTADFSALICFLFFFIYDV